MDKPLVTIGIPNYNYGKYLRECLDSVINQSYTNLEILISDNASTDDSWEIIQEYAAKDNRIIAWQNEKNIGTYPNWDKIFFTAKGKYFKILPSDDFLDKTFIERCIYKMILCDASFAFTSCRFVGDKDHKLLVSPEVSAKSYLSDEDKVSYLSELVLFVQPVVGLYLKSSVPEGFQGTHKSFNKDFVFWSMAIVRGNIVAIEDILVYQRVHGNQDRSRKDTSQGIIDFIEACNILRALPNSKNRIESFIRLNSAKYVGYGLKKIYQTEFAIAFTVLKNLIKEKILIRSFIDFIYLLSTNNIKTNNLDYYNK